MTYQIKTSGDAVPIENRIDVPESEFTQLSKTLGINEFGNPAIISNIGSVKYGPNKHSWVSGTTYDKNDIVTHSGVAYIANKTHTSETTFDPTKFLAVDSLYESSMMELMLTNLRTIKTVESISELLDLPGTTDYLVYVKGYLTINDGGQGLFRFNSSRITENDSGTIFLGWERILENNSITPEMFGARGNGINDDTIPVNSAWALSNTINHKPNATYLITSSIIANSNSIINCNKSIFTCNNNQFFDAVLIDNCDNVIVNNLSIKGPESGSGFDFGIKTIDSRSIKLIECDISNIGNSNEINEKGFGIALLGGSFSSVSDTNGCQNIEIVRPKISNIKGFGDWRGDGIYMRCCNNIKVSGGSINGTARNGFQISDYVNDVLITGITIQNTNLVGIDIEPDVETGTNDIKIINNTIYNFGCKPAEYIGVQYFGIDVHGKNSNTIISGNTITAVNSQSIACITAIDGARNTQIINNTLNCGNVAQTGLLLYAGDGAKNLTISDNRIENFIHRAIDGYNNDAVIISNNNIKSTNNSVDYGIYLLSGNFSITGNILELTGAGTASSIRAAYSTAVIIANNIINQQGGTNGIEIYAGTSFITKAVNLIGNIMYNTATGTNGIIIQSVSGAQINGVSVKSNSTSGYTNKLITSGIVNPASTPEI